MSVELRERKWCGVLGIEKVGVERKNHYKWSKNGILLGPLKIIRV